MLTILGLLIISCEAEKSNEETFNQTFKRIGLSDPFAFNYTIKTTEGELTTLSSQQVKDYISGKLFKENDITEYENYSLAQNPDNEREFALTAISIDGSKNININLIQNGFSFEIMGTCKCEAEGSYVCVASSWGGDCRCSPCSDRQKCKKTSEIKIPDQSLVTRP